jgi:hypothetical protein
MIVHYFGQRKKRRREECEDKPRQAKPDHPRLFPDCHDDGDGEKKDAERETRPETRVVSRGERTKVIVGREPARPKESLHKVT